MYSDGSLKYRDRKFKSPSGNNYYENSPNLGEYSHLYCYLWVNLRDNSMGRGMSCRTQKCREPWNGAKKYSSKA